MYGVVEVGKITPLEWALVVLFVINFSWIAVAFTSSVLGFFWLIFRAPRHGTLPTQLSGKTAIVMPIYNEAPARVFSALQAIEEDVSATAVGDSFDYFFLSDTTDPDIWIAEERALLAMRERRPNARIYYRRRKKNVSRKAGNIADFVMRWGAAYPQMVVLDADSLMTADAIIRLAATMESDPDAGIIQSLPLIVNRNTLFARVQQFAARIAGPILAGGPDRLDGARRQLLGPQRDHPHARLRRSLRHARSGRQAAVRRAYPEPRFRRGGADPARGLGGLHAADARRQLRGEPAFADRPGRARPALVPGQSAAYPRPAQQGLRARHPPAFPDRDHGLSRLAALDGAARSSASCWCCSPNTSARNISPPISRCSRRGRCSTTSAPCACSKSPSPCCSRPSCWA